MRSIFLATTVLLISTLILSSYAYYKVNSTGEDLQIILAQLEDSIKTDNWQDALSEIEALDQQWAKTNYIWTLLMDHGEIDRLGLKIEEIQHLTKLEEKDKLLVKLSLANKLAQQIPENEYPSLKNIL